MMRVMVPRDHGATDVLDEGMREVVVRPHRYQGDTYPSIWFYFRVTNDSEQDIPAARITVEELPPGHDSYEPFWKHCLWSRDGVAWERIPEAAQRFGPTTLTVEVPLRPQEHVWIAETYPLPYQRYADLASHLAQPPSAGVNIDRRVLCTTAGGRPVDSYRVQGTHGRQCRSIVIVAGQHAVEQSGKILADMVLRGYHSGAFAGTPMDRLLETHSLTVVPMANPDGCYDGRMNTNWQGVVMDSPKDDSPETASILGLIDEVHPQALINCHGWGNESGEPPYEGVYRWTDDDPLYKRLVERVPGCDGSESPHLYGDIFIVESHAREQHGAHCALLEINWNWCLPADGGPARQPTIQDINYRAMHYLTAISEFCIETAK